MTNIEASSDVKDLAQESTLEKVWFPAYLTFTVCFYSLRFIFGWGSALTTGYVSDMPPYLAALKDVVWLGLLGAALCSRAIGRAIDQAKRHPAIYLLLGSFCGWMLLCAGIHMMYYAEPLNDSFLHNARMPLKYIPAALLAPAFIGNWRRVGMIWKRLNWVAIGFAVFEFVSVLGGWKHPGLIGEGQRFGLVESLAAPKIGVSIEGVQSLQFWRSRRLGCSCLASYLDFSCVNLAVQSYDAPWPYSPAVSF